ncbi:MAG TPA: hypothetical protein VFG06_10075 [Thermodesulfovibrionales bacterium]|jgi:hypothetical protein|nr:hypothetical protein [Thermodesulfovibrionales bacterium]
MKYLIVIFILIIIIGILGNRELSRDRARIHRMMREYSFRTYNPEDDKNPPEEGEGKKE